ncbi:hypothetical protein Tco_1575897 [Tanacetum coccineum]
MDGGAYEDLEASSPGYKEKASLGRKFLKIKQAIEEEQNQPEVMQELLLKLMKDLQILKGIQQAEQEELAAQNFLINLNFPMADDGCNFDENDYDEDDFDKEEGDIDIDIFQIEDEILRDKLLNVNLLIDRIEALNLTPSTPLVPKLSPLFAYSRWWNNSEGDIIFLDNLLNDDLILEYERFTFDIEPDAPVINNFDELNEDECFDPGGGEIDVSQNIKDDDSFAFVIQTFLPYLTYHVDSPLLLSTKNEDTKF